DDHTLIRQSWSFILNADTRFSVVAEAGSGEEAVEMAKQIRPDIVIMDINLPGINGMEAAQLIKKNSPATKILGVSMHTQPAYARTMMKHGAMGYVTKNSSRFELYKAIIEIHNNRTYVCNEVKSILVDQMMGDEKNRNGYNALSRKEIEIIGFIKKGHSSKEIAELLSVCVKTVEAHRHNILKKLHLKNTAAMINHINSLPMSF
ncbi:MAG TPA: response regulator transcription factor, partial [Chitinophagaceae bacterium]|nr:response regulator transcription factor [Chitinophagaceae bacterium]